MKRWLTRRNLVILGVGAILVGGWWMPRRGNGGEGQRRVAIVRKGGVEVKLSISGKVEAGRKATLNFSSSGVLGYVKVAEGDRVRKGQYLAGLDLGDLQAAERAAYYNYLAADANAKEVEDSVKGHDKDETFAQKNDRVAAQTTRDKAYDAWLSAQRAVKNANLIAPFAGMVTSISITASGDTVGVADGITVVDPESLYFESEVDESDLGKIREGVGVKIMLDAYPDKGWDGVVEKIGFETGISDSGATVLPVKIRFRVTEDEMQKLKLGLNGDVEIVAGEAKNVLTLPIEAVVDGEVEMENGEKRKVEVGLEGDVDVEVKGGVKEGEKVVIR